MGDVFSGEITQQTLLRIIKLNRRKQIDTPTDLGLLGYFILLCSTNWNLVNV